MIAATLASIAHCLLANQDSAGLSDASFKRDLFGSFIR
jgi:hypothetical protein